MPATTIEKTSGDEQYGGICTALTLPLKVRITDGTNGVAGTTVTFAIASYPTNTAYQVISASEVTSDASGYAETFLTLGKLKGIYTVTATAAGLTGSPITFTEYAISIVTLEEFKRYHGLPSDTDDSNDDILANVVGTITEICEEELEQPVCQRSIVEILNGSGRYKIRVLQARIISIDEIQERDDIDDAWADLLDDLDEAMINPDSLPFGDTLIELQGDTAFVSGNKTMRIAYQGGFNPMPRELKKMALEMCEIMWKESGKGNSLLGISTVNSSVSGVNQNTVYKELRNGRWDDIINKFKLP